MSIIGSDMFDPTDPGVDYPSPDYSTGQQGGFSIGDVQINVPTGVAYPGGGTIRTPGGIYGTSVPPLYPSTAGAPYSPGTYASPFGSGGGIVWILLIGIVAYVLLK